MKFLVANSACANALRNRICRGEGEVEVLTYNTSFSVTSRNLSPDNGVSSSLTSRFSYELNSLTRLHQGSTQAISAKRGEVVAIN
jgi:hypothetical protein